MLFSSLAVWPALSAALSSLGQLSHYPRSLSQPSPHPGTSCPLPPQALSMALTPLSDKGLGVICVLAGLLCCSRQRRLHFTARSWASQSLCGTSAGQAAGWTGNWWRPQHSFRCSVSRPLRHPSQGDTVLGRMISPAASADPGCTGTDQFADA